MRTKAAILSALVAIPVVWSVFFLPDKTPESLDVVTGRAPKKEVVTPDYKFPNITTTTIDLFQPPTTSSNSEEQSTAPTARSSTTFQLPEEAFEQPAAAGPVLPPAFSAPPVFDDPSSSPPSSTTTLPPPTTTTQLPVDPDTLSYPGESGVTALDLLGRYAVYEASGEGENAFVTSINGRDADSSKNEYWALYHNGEFAQVGAGSLVTEDGDTITWQIELF